MDRERLTRSAVEAIEAAWEEGCPVAGQPNETAAIAVRRWMSSKRRGVREGDFEQRVKDLCKGLIARMEENPKLVGRLSVDYAYLAERIAAALVEASKSSTAKSD